MSKISSAQLDSIAVNYTSKCDLVRTHAENTDKSETNTLAAYIVLSVDDFATRHTNTSYRSLDFCKITARTYCRRPCVTTCEYCISEREKIRIALSMAHELISYINFVYFITKFAIKMFKAIILPHHY